MIGSRGRTEYKQTVPTNFAASLPPVTDHSPAPRPATDAVPRSIPYATQIRKGYPAVALSPIDRVRWGASLLLGSSGLYVHIRRARECCQGGTHAFTILPCARVGLEGVPCLSTEPNDERCEVRRRGLRRGIHTCLRDESQNLGSRLLSGCFTPWDGPPAEGDKDSSAEGSKRQSQLPTRRSGHAATGGACRGIGFPHLILREPVS